MKIDLTRSLILTLSLFLSSPALANIEFEVIRCQKSLDKELLDIDLQFARQNREPDGSFSDSGLFQTTIKLAESPTTLGKIVADGKSVMAWKRQPGTSDDDNYMRNVAVSEDGSLFASSAITHDVFSNNIQSLPGLSQRLPDPPHFNRVFLYVLKVKVNNPVIDYLYLTLQNIEFSSTYHLQISGLNPGGVYPFAQLDVECTTDFTKTALF